MSLSTPLYTASLLLSSNTYSGTIRSYSNCINLFQLVVGSWWSCTILILLKQMVPQVLLIRFWRYLFCWWWWQKISLLVQDYSPLDLAEVDIEVMDSGGSGNTPSVTPAQVNDGGVWCSRTWNRWHTGGVGGASAAGSDGTSG